MKRLFLKLFNTYSYFLSVLTGIIDFVKSTTEGDAMHKDEYVPTTTPIINANEKPLIDSPPNKNIINNTKTYLKRYLMSYSKYYSKLY